MLHKYSTATEATDRHRVALYVAYATYTTIATEAT
jgi:hypothetical protein